jgi:hypothetical protein
VLTECGAERLELARARSVLMARLLNGADTLASKLDSKHPVSLEFRALISGASSARSW